MNSILRQFIVDGSHWRTLLMDNYLLKTDTGWMYRYEKESCLRIRYGVAGEYKVALEHNGSVIESSCFEEFSAAFHHAQWLLTKYTHLINNNK